MAIKTFTVSETLTASDTNTYLANAGLVYVKSQTITNGVASVSVTDAFSSTYDAYKIVVTGGGSAAANTIAFQLNGVTSGYYIGIIYWAFAGGSGSASVYGAANQSTWQEVGSCNTNGLSMNMDILNPNLAKWKTYSCATPSMNTAGSMVWTNGLCSSTTQATGFTLSIGSTFTGGTITVYGYRKA